MSKISVVFTLFVLITTTFARTVFKGNQNGENREQHYNLADFDVIYDQKQNASENYRLDISGVDVVIANPASILQAIFSPLTALSLLGDFTKNAPIPVVKKNPSVNEEDQFGINYIGSASMSSSTDNSNDVEELQKTTSKNLIKNFEEKIQVQELLPGFEKKDVMENVPQDSK